MLITRPFFFEQEMHCMHPAYLEASLSHSLKNMWLDQLDLFYLHNTAEMQLPEVGKLEYMRRLRDAFHFMEQARKQNNIRFYGMVNKYCCDGYVSTRSFILCVFAELLSQATWSCFTTTPNSQEHLELEEVVQLARSVGGEDHGMRFIQLPINAHMPQAFMNRSQTVGDRQMTVLEAAEELGLYVFSSRSVCAGQQRDMECVQNVFRKCKIPSRQMPETPVGMALQLARSIKGVTTALVGMKSNHVQENLSILSLEPLDQELVVQCLDQIEK